MLEGVRSIARCGYGGPLAAKFRSTAARMNKRKSAVAIARKPVTPAWLLMKRREYYNAIDPGTLANKLRYYKARKREPAA